VTAPFRDKSIIPAPRVGWQDKAVCSNDYNDPDFWMPDGIRGATFAAQASAAAEICRTCPVMLDCLRFKMRDEIGMAKDSRYGVFGGMTGTERWRHEKWLRDQRDAKQAAEAAQQALAA